MTVVRAPSSSRVIARFPERGDFHELLDEAVVLMGAAVANWRERDTDPPLLTCGPPAANAFYCTALEPALMPLMG
jgi:hypothetical protein